MMDALQMATIEDEIEANQPGLIPCDRRSIHLREDRPPSVFVATDIRGEIKRVCVKCWSQTIGDHIFIDEMDSQYDHGFFFELIGIR